MVMVSLMVKKMLIRMVRLILVRVILICLMVKVRDRVSRGSRVCKRGR